MTTGPKTKHQKGETRTGVVPAWKIKKIKKKKKKKKGGGGLVVLVVKVN